MGFPALALSLDHPLTYPSAHVRSSNLHSSIYLLQIYLFICIIVEISTFVLPILQDSWPYDLAAELSYPLIEYVLSRDLPLLPFGSCLNINVPNIQTKQDYRGMRITQQGRLYIEKTTQSLVVDAFAVCFYDMIRSFNSSYLFFF